MNKNDMFWTEFFIVMCMLWLMIIGYEVKKIGTMLKERHEASQVVLKQANPKCRLPCLCRRYYNSGTDEWLDCMMVGYK
jgi:hypothetical protein